MASIRIPGLAAFFMAGLMGCTNVYLAPPLAGEPGGAAGRTRGVLLNDGHSRVWVLRVDGERRGVPPHGRYQLLPGRHTIRVAYFWSRGYLTWTGHELVDYAFHVKGGETLRVMSEHAEEPGYKGTWSFWIADATSGEIVTAEGNGPVVTREATGERTEPFFRVPME